MTTTRRALLLTIVPGASLLAAQTARHASAVRDRDCDDFKSQKKAQRFYKKNGGPQDDPHNLDADNDGKACEDYDYRR